MIKMLLNKKKVDIDNIVESIVLFFNNYFITLSIDVTDKICNSKNISIDDSYYEIIKQLVASFFKLLHLICDAIIQIKRIRAITKYIICLIVNFIFKFL